MSFRNKAQSFKAQGHSVYSDRHEIVSENEWNMIDDMERDENAGRDIFRCYVLDASDYVDPSVGDSIGSYIFARLMPVDWISGRPNPCGKGVKSTEMRDFIISESIIAKSETKLGDTRHFPLTPGDVVWAYWVNPDKIGEGAVFMIDKVEQSNDSKYLFDCLKIKRKKPNLNYNNTGGGVVTPAVPGAPWSIPETPNKCLRYYNGLRAKDVRLDKSSAHLGGTVSQIPNCVNCFRGGKIKNDADIKALQDKGIKVVIRFNWEAGGGFTKEVEKAKVQAAGMTYWGTGLNSSKAPTPREWRTIKNYLLQGNVYIHCKAGVDRTGAVVARWILETESALRGMSEITDEFKQEVLDYTISYPSAHWKYGEKDPKKQDEDKTPDRPKNKRTKLTDDCENKKIKEWGFDVNVGHRGNRYAGTKPMVPDQQAAQIISQQDCKK